MTSNTGYDDAHHNHNHCLRQLQLPAVVACGYRRIQSTKSQLTFPAWLVALRRTTTATTLSVDGDDLINTSTASHPSSTSTTRNTSDDVGVQLVWRSKRDWLLLGRKSKTASFPKSALKKLADTSISTADLDDQSQDDTRPTTVPWTRPLSFSDNHNHDKDDSRHDESSSINMIIQQSMTEMEMPSSPNHFRPEMKKSIQQLDQFLQQVEKEAVTGSAATDASSLCQDDIIDQTSGSDIAKSAWNHFCRKGDTEGLIIDEVRKMPSSTSESIQSSKLGQYFASETNARLVVDSALRALDGILMFSATHSNPLSNTDAKYTGNKRRRSDLNHVVFVEPSCGNGDILIALLTELQQKSEFFESVESVSIYAYDIDPNVLSVCAHRLESMMREDVSMSNLFKTIDFTCQDFLTTIAPNDSTMSIDGGTVVCCLGGPPYTTGAGSNTLKSSDRATESLTIERDLPARFVRHCQMKWSANIISFLMPKRYKKMEWRKDFDMVCVTDELPSSTFFFRGNVEVTQPSILQTFIEGSSATTKKKRSN